MSRSYGPLISRFASAPEQSLAAEHPGPAVWLALNTGRLSAEYAQVNPDCRRVAAPLALPSGDAAILLLALTRGRDLESLKRPLERLASTIHSEMGQAHSRSR